MCSVGVFVGLDYHQDQVQVCLLNEAGEVVCRASFTGGFPRCYLVSAPR